MGKKKKYTKYTKKILLKKLIIIIQVYDHFV